MSKNLSIESISHQLSGIAYSESSDGQKTTCFVEGALLGERVEAKLIGLKKQIEHWQALKIIEASPARTSPDCQWVDQCGGCQAAHIEHDAQIEFKQAAIIEQLTRAVKNQSIEILPVIKSQTWHYRRRARLAYQYQTRSRKASLGFRERKSSNIVNFDQCIALEAPLSELIVPLRRFCESSLSDPACIGHVELINPEKSGQPVVLFRLIKRLIKRDVEKLSEFAELENIRLFVQQPEAKVDDILAADANQLVEIKDGQLITDYPRVFYRLDSGIQVDFTPLDFIQANAAVNNAMINSVIKMLKLTEKPRVFEFFSGVGNFTLPLADAGASVESFELVKSSVERARHNAEQAGLERVKCHQIDLTDKPKMQQLLKGGCDLVLLDPPRTGAAELIPFLPATKAKQIVYVSCNPTTLSRDARQLKELGYQLESAGLIDMFPNTPHAEAIAVFKRDAKAKQGKKKRGGKTVFGF